MRLTAKAVADDGTEVVLSSRPVDVVRWEAATKKKIGDGLGYGDMARILFFAGQRTGAIAAEAKFDPWLEALDDLEMVNDTDPTSPPSEA